MFSAVLCAVSHGQYSLESIKQQKSQQQELRQYYFSAAEYAAFFAQEDNYDRYMLQHLEIIADSDLDEVERQQQLQTLEATLPEETRSSRKKASQHADIYDTALAMRKDGANEEEIFQMRANSLGEYAATAMAELDSNRRQWQQRLDDYAIQKKQIADSGLDRQDKDLAINELIDNNFSGPERLRVRALSSTL